MNRRDNIVFVEFTPRPLPHGERDNRMLVGLALLGLLFVVLVVLANVWG